MNYVLSEEEYNNLKALGDAASRERIVAYKKQVDDASARALERMRVLIRGFSNPFSGSAVQSPFVRDVVTILKDFDGDTDIKL